ncbi:hypothetical protein JZ785_27650 (plasmid) [Alicyclobacillus curvatus]|nr:hypothetical protein JZ785_27650 [Alicyclobacillus curvatus]
MNWNGVRGKLIPVGVCSVALFGAIGCGTSQSFGPSGYINYQPGEGVMFLTFSENSGTITGTAYETSITLNQLAQSNTWTLSGQQSGNNITLQFSGSGFTTWSGTMDGKNIDLEVPATNGTVQANVFVPGSLNEYNADVSKIKDVATAEQAVSAQNALESKINQDIQNIDGKLMNIQHNSMLPNDMSTIQTDFAQEQKDFAAYQQAVQQGSFNNTAKATFNINDDATKITNDQSQFNSDASQINDEIMLIQQIESQIHTEMSQVPNFKPTGTILSDSSITSAESGIQSQIKQDQTKVQTYVTASQKMLNQVQGQN